MLSCRNRRGGCVAAVILSVAACGCSSNLPKGFMPSAFGTAEGRVSVELLRWPNGPNVMICTDITGGGSSGGTSVSGPPWIATARGYQSGKDGRRVEWELESKDGRSVDCRLNGKNYDLKNGALFVVTGPKMQVEQISRDLSGVQADVESCKSFVHHDPAVSKLLEEVKPAKHDERTFNPGD